MCELIEYDFKIVLDLLLITYRYITTEIALIITTFYLFFQNQLIVI